MSTVKGLSLREFPHAKWLHCPITVTGGLSQQIWVILNNNNNDNIFYLNTVGFKANIAYGAV